LGFHLLQHEEAISKATVPPSMERMPGADRVMGAMNPCSRILLEACFCRCPTTDFHVDLPETSCFQSPAKQQPDGSDDDAMDLGSPPSCHSDDNCLFPAEETNVVSSLVAKFLGVSDLNEFHFINQQPHKDEEELQDVSTAFRRMLLMLFGFATHETIKNAQAINQNFADTLSLFLLAQTYQCKH